MFNVNGTSYTCQNAVKKLLELQRSSPIEGWRAVEVCTEGEGEARKPKLKCKHCNSLMSVSNPAQSLKTHMSERACKGLKRLATAAAAAQMAAGNGGGSSSTSTGSGAGVATAGDGAGTATTNPILGKRKKGSGISIMCATAHQQQCFEKSIARFFFKNGIPLQLTEDKDLKQAVAHVGLLPPSRHALSNQLLDAEYDTVHGADVSRLAQQRLIQLTTDGWRRRAAVRGVPLINVMALTPVGKPIFCKVVSAAGEVKDQHWIAARHLEWATEITDGQLDRLLGMVMDNTKANM
jgi:hypothetical protein